MASSSPPTSRAIGSDVVESDDAQSVLIANRLRQTRRYVKLIDLCSGVVTLLGGILGYLLFVSLIDHWVVDLPRGLRFALLLVLLLGVAAFFVWRLLPPLLYSVNPVYAAQTIEQAAPSLKNSLINLVLLAGRRNGVSGVIYDGLRREAAEQLAHVPPETMVDRAPLIKAGYWLVALLAIAALYKVLSPKDPVQSVARVAAPWMNIDRPARVRIVDVEPGDAEVYRGQTVEVTALIEGLDSDEEATLLYSTRDGQFIDQPIAMRRDGSQRFHGTLSLGPRGIQQSLAYRIKAGDAATDEFVLQVKNAPHIDVKRIVYQFPGYTQLAERIVEGQADLSALEGTRVRIEAEANQPIGAAYLELFAGSSDIDSPDAQPAQAIAMKTEGNRATGQLTLLLQADRKTPQAAAYQIRFTTEGGQRNEQPARNRIEVTPDLAPDIEWLQPRSADMELPENASTTLEIRAYDPDFAVQQIQVSGAVRGTTKLTAELLDAPLAGQVIRKYQLVPRQLGLTAGDTLIYWAEARDNRLSPTGTPAPNSQRTTNYRIRIVRPDPTQPSDPGGAPAGEPPTDGGQGERSTDATGQQGSQAKSNDQGGSNETGGESETGQQGGEQSSGEGETGQAGQQGTGQSGQSSEGSQPNAGEQGGVQGDGTQQGGAEQNNSEQEAADQGGAGGSSADRRGGSDRDRRQNGAEQGTAGQERSEGSGGNDRGQTDESLTESRGRGDRNGASEPNTDGTRAADSGSDTGRGERRDGEASEGATRGEPQADDESQPVAPDGSNDSEAFERILRHLREQQKDDAGASRGQRDQESRGDDSAAARAEPDANEPGRDESRGRDPSESGGTREPRGDRAGDRSADRSSARPDGGTGTGETTERNAERATRDPSNTPAAGGPQPENQPPAGQSPADGQSPDEATGSTSSEAQSPSPSQSPASQAAGDPAAGRPSERTEPDARDDRSGKTGSGEPSAGDASSARDRSNTGSGDGTPAGAAPDDQSSPMADSTGVPPNQASRGPGGGQQNGDGIGDSPGSDQTDAADQANLEYARQATDLALQHLKDQQQSAAELRERLGWTKEEMEAFVRRWEQMQREARQSGPRGEQARRRLSDQLRGLGLQPGAERVRSSQARKDDLRELREGGNGVPVPAEYLEQYRAFLKGARPK